MISPWVANTVIFVTVTVWVASFLADIFVKNYTPPEGINLVFSAIIGAVVTILKRDDRGNGGRHER